MLIIQWINPYTAHPTKLKMFAFRIQHQWKFQITKITLQFIRLKKRFVATFCAKKSSHMGAFFRAEYGHRRKNFSGKFRTYFT